MSGAASGPGHAFVVGDGLNLVFHEAIVHPLPSVLDARRGHALLATNDPTHSEQVRDLYRGPSSVGTYTTTWYVAGKPVDRWTFYNGRSD